jgi:hypothetical protein
MNEREDHPKFNGLVMQEISGKIFLTKSETK